jgi:hypothetical protein
LVLVSDFFFFFLVVPNIREKETNPTMRVWTKLHRMFTVIGKERNK